MWVCTWLSDTDSMKRFLHILLLLPPLAGATACGALRADSAEESGAFEYRDVYLPDYNRKANGQLSLNNIDDDWGIWGHNLGVVLPENPSMQAYAKVNGGANSDQFCFSSNKLFGYITDYIDDNFMFRDSVRFAILPNDNDLVCLCTDCVRLGNSRGDASPAVFYLIERLAKKYPEHEFFTSYYLTTRSLPDEVMPPNTGVLVSAMEFPLTAVENNKEIGFLTLLDEWSGKTGNIYVWDYLNNFDDYFTPSPIFGIMQRRLKLYKNAGVNGVFLNGSGNDFSVFSRLRRAVLAQLLINPDLDWEEVLRRYASEYYPQSGADIADFMVLQERMIERTGKAIPHYAGVGEIVGSYLPEKEFVDFYNKIVKHKKTASPQERAELETLTDAMALTMLELKRINGDYSDASKLKERLGRLPGMGIRYYNEGAWSISEYLDNYNYMEEQARASEGSNLLKGVRLRAVTPLDEDYTDLSILTDGVLGIPSNYHNGNLITSASPSFSIAVPRVPGMKRLKVWLVYNPGFRIGLPQEVYVSSDGGHSARVTPERPMGSGHAPLEFDVPPGTEDVVLTLVSNPDVRTMAIDEIEAF